MWGGAERKHTCAGRRRLRRTRWRTGWRATSALKPVGSIGSRLGYHRILCWSVGSPGSFALLSAITAAPTLLISTSMSLPVKVTYKPILNARKLTCMPYFSEVKIANICEKLQVYFFQNCVKHKGEMRGEKWRRSEVLVLWHQGQYQGWILWNMGLPLQWPLLHHRFLYGQFKRFNI